MNNGLLRGFPSRPQLPYLRQGIVARRSVTGIIRVFPRNFKKPFNESTVVENYHTGLPVNVPGVNASILK